MRSTTPFRALIGAAAVLLAVSGCSADETANSRHDHYRGLASPDRRVQPGRTRHPARLRDLGRPDQRERRAPRQGRQDRRQGRRDHPGHRRQQLQQPDLQGQGRPGPRQPVVTAEHPRLRHCGEEQDALRLPVLRLARYVLARLQLHLLRTAGHSDQSGQGVRRVGRESARRSAAEDRRVPHAGRPLRRAGGRGRREDPFRGRYHDRLPGPVPGDDEELRLGGQRDEGRRS